MSSRIRAGAEILGPREDRPDTCPPCLAACVGTSAPSRKFPCIRAPLHPRSLQRPPLRCGRDGPKNSYCSSVTYLQVCALLAPCDRGAGGLSVPTGTSAMVHQPRASSSALACAGADLSP